MDDQIIAVFCLCDDLLKACVIKKTAQCHMGDAEVMTTALIACWNMAATLRKPAALSMLHTISPGCWMPAVSIAACIASNRCS